MENLENNVNEEIKEIVNEIHLDELEELWNTHKKLNPKKKSETREEWENKYKPREFQIDKWSNFFESKIDYLQEKYEIKKKETIEGIAAHFRSRQENELDKNHSLINPVKISLIMNLNKSYNPNYKKKTVKKKKSGKKHKGRKLSLLSYTIESLKIDQNIITGVLVNKGNIPLQSINLNIESEGNKIKIANAIGENFQIALGEVFIPFIEASMTEEYISKQFKLTLAGFIEEAQNLVLKSTVEDTRIRKTISSEYDI